MGQIIQSSFKRYEKKYMLSKQQYETILEGMKPYMKADVYGKTTNCSIYYDTPNWDLIRKSIEKPVYKEKLRVRSYGTPSSQSDVFIEIKKKYEDVVYKRRISMSCENVESYLAGELWLSPKSQIAREIEWFQKRNQAEPKVFIAYDRTSYAGSIDPELRITFDQNIRYRDYDLNLGLGDFGEQLLSEKTVLMEIKIPMTTPLWLVKLLSSIEAKPSSFSKYGTFYKEHVMKQTEKERNKYCA